GTTELEEELQRARRRVPQSATHPGRARPALTATARRAFGTALRASLRDRRDAACLLAWAHEHSKAAADSHSRIQSRTPDATSDRRGHAARATGAAHNRRCHSLVADPLAVGRDDRSWAGHPTLFTDRASLDHEIPPTQRCARNGFHHGLLGVDREGADSAVLISDPVRV